MIALLSWMRLPPAGTAKGGLFALQCPDLQNYSHARAHKQPTLDAVATGQGIASASADWIRFHDTGSVPKLTIPAAQVPTSTCTSLRCLPARTIHVLSPAQLGVDHCRVL